MLQMMIDNHALNKQIYGKKYFMLPCIDDLLDKLASTIVFSSLELLQRYDQARISKGDAPKTTFRIWFGCNQFKVINFGLTNVPTLFQRVMNQFF